MIYAVIDTNVLVSAFIPKNQDSSTAKVWSAMLNFDIIPMYSEEIIEEYKDVLHRKKFDIPEQLIKDALNHIMVNGVRGERVLSDDFFPDPKDTTTRRKSVSLRGQNTVKFVQNEKYSSKSADFLRFYLYLCHVIDDFACLDSQH